MNISLKISEELLTIIKRKYHRYQLTNPMEYAVFFAKVDAATITVYKSPKKPLYSLTIGGKSEANIEKILHELGIDEYDQVEAEKVAQMKPQKVSKNFVFNDDQIGSDEVGTGDFFGPVTVVAALVKKTDIKRLKELGVMDSKKITDEKIKAIGKIVIKEFPYSSLTLDNVKYNELTLKKGFNENKIKAYLHNRALCNLHRRYPKINNIYVDEFVAAKNYYRYLSSEKNVERDIYFHAKGESYFPSVALASVIARYSFLLHMEKLSRKYHTDLPFGAGKHVEEFAKQFVQEHGVKELDKIVKKHFTTYQRVIS
ncbi:MAG: ribonuclease HIII [Bacilli bacterium]|nr:ribonuclease HIII [Bacilli bacterium]